MIKNRLREIRLKLAASRGTDLTQTEMADMLQVKLPQYNSWENQQTQPNFENAFLIAQRLHMLIEEIFYWQPK